MLNRSYWIPAAFIAWMMFVLATFYAVQKPITAEDIAALAEFPQAFEQSPSLIALLDVLLNTLTTSLLVVVAAVSGFPLCALPYPHDDGSLTARAEFWLLAIGVGFGAMALVTFGLSLLGWLAPPALVLIALGLLVTKPHHPLRLLAADLWRCHKVALPRPLAIFIVVSLALTLLAALAPPTAWDALVYHLAVPRRAIELGRLAPSGDIIPHENFPLFMSSLYLLAMTIKGDIAAQLIHSVYGFLTIGLIALTARQFYTRAAVPYALAVALSMPMFLLLSAWAYNDLALSFYTLAAVYAYKRWCESHSTHYLILSALMVGCAMGLKYTSFVLPVGLVALMLMQARQHSLLAAAQFSSVSLLTAAPWYLKNLFFTGNPVYPFVLGGAQWDALRAVWYARGGTGIGFDPVALLSLPLVLTLGTRDANYFDGRVGPLILMLAPLLLVLRQRRDAFMLMFILFFAFWVVGVMGSLSLWQSRLLLPALVLLAAPLGNAVVNLAVFDRPAFSLKRIVHVVSALVLILTLVTQVVGFAMTNPIAYVLGAESREHSLLRRLGAHADAMRVINQLPADARVQFMWEPRSYLAARSVRADPLIDALPHLVATTGSLDAGVRQLKSEGFTHILVYEAGAQFAFDNLRDQVTDTDATNLRRLESEHARIVYENRSYRLLELK